jgi:hypothetical protein
MFIEAHQHVLVVQQSPGARAVTETVHFVPPHVPPPGTHVVSRGTMPRGTGQQSKSHVLHLVQVKDALQLDHQGDDAGQETPLERTVVVGEALAGRVEPREHMGTQQECPGVLGIGKKETVGHDGHQPAWQTGLEHLGRHTFFFVASGRLPGFLQTSEVQAVLLEKLPQGHFGDAEFPRPLEEVE